ncbi:ferritin-like domain-containing protein [Variovorax ureilyticus]|uniref:ferritin-like domain-containing protein n=1 Tax=Variovorax ureilyticus TaxID=1836198 RepID=UPI003D67226D
MSHIAPTPSSPPSPQDSDAGLAARAAGGDAQAFALIMRRDGANDVRILNTALGAELEAVAAYQVSAESKLLDKPVLDLATTFQGHHKQHADLLAATITKLGGKPVVAKATYDFPTEQLKSQADVLRFAAKLEQGAVSAYLGAVPLFQERDLSKAAASILSGEAMHWAVLRQAVGEAPVPGAFVS